ncbi:MAG TPA: hypothetical protein VGN76_12890 [Gemmatimonadales bacterium]|jgi:hypothetical protein|nr:hypothetical protein [Gemmatimonadales bacterium]
MTAWRTSYLLLLTSHLVACGTLPPLRGKIDVGREAFAVFVGGSGVSGDLYAVRADGGPAFPITYTPVGELAPALAPNGTDLAFLRSQSLRDSIPATVWVMNLLSGSERELELAKGAGAPERVGWSNDGTKVIVRTGEGLYRFDAPPAKPDVSPVPAADSAVAESSLAVLLGDPVFARVVLCKRTSDLCLSTRRGAPGILAQAARDPVRWGTDSVAFLVGDNLLQIRPLSKGRPRALNWSNVPVRPRQLTFFEGEKAEKQGSGDAGKF